METLNPNIDSLVHDLPPTPAIMPRLLALLSDPESGTESIIELLALDPGLAAAVLRASRSAFYGTRGQSVESLDEAVAAIGFKEVYRIVALYALSETAREPLVLYGLSPEQFWRKSVACALAMEMLCGEMGAPGTTGYTIGLLHAIGEVFVSRIARRSSPRGGLPLVAFGQPQTLPEQELAAAGFTQSQAAAYAMRRWFFPEAIVEPIEFQFRPHEAPVYTQMALRLRLGKWLTHLVLGDEATARAVNPDFHFAITMPGNSFARMVDDLRGRLDEAAGALHGTGCVAA
ncbi:MAG TPA: HDOD domain-containing protein [Opitutaceae bacterium]|nr:HDOD domain-containing protein [Opitutaceae bacterium]